MLRVESKFCDQISRLLKIRKYMMDIGYTYPIYSTGFYSLNFEQLWVSGLIAMHYKKPFS